MDDVRLPPDSRIGAGHLTVSDLARSVAFYREHVGLAARADAPPGTARLHAGGSDLLVLRESRDAVRPHRATGLYHFALRVPSRAALGAVLAHFAASRTPLTGASDHGVSEALYLPDPDEIGIEIYADRPREQWPIVEGTIRMLSEELDWDGLHAAAPDAPWTGIAPGTDMGHVHLHVAALDPVERFYVDTLGFERTLRLGGSALFVAAGGYHHHVGLNTWHGLGAPPPPPGAIGLDHYVIELPDDAAVERVLARARAADTPESASPEGPLLADPAANRLRLARAARG